MVCAVALALKTWPEKTQQAIADQVGCVVSYVNRIKQELFTSEKLTIPETRVGADGNQSTVQRVKEELMQAHKLTIPETRVGADGNQSTVQRVKEELMQAHKLTIPETRVGADGKQYPTTYQKKDALEDITETQQAIADQVGCVVSYVNRIKQELFTSEKLTIPETRVGADGKERPTTYTKKDALENITETQQEEMPDDNERSYTGLTCGQIYHKFLYPADNERLHTGKIL